MDATATQNLSARIDLGALRRNFRLLSARAPGAAPSALVKSDAYGHGAPAAARALVEEGCRFLVVCDLGEALELRRAGLSADILIVGPILPEEAPEVLAGGFAVALGNLETAHALDQAARAQERSARVHLKFDTGMGRFGFLDSAESLDALLSRLAACSRLDVEGALTHFSEADLPASDFTHEQARRFRAVLEALETRGVRPRWIHAANSSAVEYFPETAFSMVRLGIAMYGAHSNPALEDHPLALEPVMTAACRIVDVRQVPAGHAVSYARTFVTRRPSRLALLPVGYGHGYPRRASGRAHVQIRGERAPIVGRVTMNLTVVDVTDIHKVGPGDTAVLFGDGGPRVEELARAADTIPHEILCNMGRALPRRVVDDKS